MNKEILPRKMVHNNEEVLVELRPPKMNWYLLPAIVFAVSIFVPALLFLTIPWMIATDVAYRNTCYALTSKRVIVTSGILTKKFTECPIEKIQNIDLKLPAFSNIGIISFDTAGTTFKEIVWGLVGNPQATYQKVSSLINK